MSNIDKLPAAQTPEHLDADSLFGLLVKRADELADRRLRRGRRT